MVLSNYFDVLKELEKSEMPHPIQWATGIDTKDLIGLDKLYVDIDGVDRSDNAPMRVFDSRYNHGAMFNSLYAILNHDCVFSVSAGYSPKSPTVNESHMYLMIKTLRDDCAKELREML